MSLHSFSNVWLHLIWATNNREKVLLDNSADTVSKFLFEYSKQKEIYMRTNFVNSDLVHVLIGLPTRITIEECVKLFKGSSSHFINKERIIPTKFSWGRGYGVFSVSHSNVEKVTKYINNQKEHHRIKSFSEEYELFLKKNNINY